MKVIASTGREDIAMVYIMQFEDGKMLECVESLQPPNPRSKKWILLVSTMFGCPVGCTMCDAGGGYQSRASADQILQQIDFMIQKRFPDGMIDSQQFKIQFARMGEPALNSAVLQVLRQLPQLYYAPGLMPSVSTVAPAGRESFFDELLQIKEQFYSQGHFQFQFSLHTTDLLLRDQIIPIKKWSFEQMAAYGDRFYQPGDRKITLNFALAQDTPVDAQVLLQHFSPEKFLIKITPLNPTYRAEENKLTSYIDPYHFSESDQLIESLDRTGYQVIVSIGETEENLIGSNCGQYLRRHLEAEERIQDGYTYELDRQ